MQNTNLPPLPPIGSKGSDVCITVRLYTAIWDDLSFSEQKALSSHIKSCPVCLREREVMLRVTHMVATLKTSQPSQNVDQAVMAAIASRVRPTSRISRSYRTTFKPQRSRQPVLRWGGLAAAAAAVLFAIISLVSLLHPAQPQVAFALPANLTWQPYVLYHTQSMTTSEGQPYQVTSYHNMTDQNMKIEMVMPGQMHVVVVKDANKSLGLDLMHHVAQWGTKIVDVNDDMFELDQVRHALQTKQAAYQGKAQFQHQDVYRIRYNDGTVLLLDMQYMPVNVLALTRDTGTEKPVYNTLEWLTPSHVPDSTWAMNVPAGFSMGQVSTQP